MVALFRAASIRIRILRITISPGVGRSSAVSGNLWMSTFVSLNKFDAAWAQWNPDFTELWGFLQSALPKFQHNIYDESARPTPISLPFSKDLTQSGPWKWNVRRIPTLTQDNPIPRNKLEITSLFSIEASSIRQIQQQDLMRGLRLLNERSMQYPPRASIDIFQSDQKVGVMRFSLPVYANSNNQLAASTYATTNPDFIFGPSQGPCRSDSHWVDHQDALREGIDFAIRDLSYSRTIQIQETFPRWDRAFFQNVPLPFTISMSAQPPLKLPRKPNGKKIQLPYQRFDKIKLGRGDVLNALHALKEIAPRSCLKVSMEPDLIQGVDFQPVGSGSLEIIGIPATDVIVAATPYTPYDGDLQWRRRKSSANILAITYMGGRFVENQLQGPYITSTSSPVLIASVSSPFVYFKVVVDIAEPNTVTKEDVIRAYFSLEGKGPDRWSIDDRHFFLFGDSPHFVPSVDLVRRGEKLGSVRLVLVKDDPDEIFTWEK